MVGVEYEKQTLEYIKKLPTTYVMNLKCEPLALLEIPF